MGNKEHLALLNQGVNVWNDWRQKNPEIQPDLSEEDFSNLDLCGVDLRSSNLSRTNFSGTHLSRASLSGADLSWANFKGTDLRQTNLVGANLNCTTLCQVNLSESNLLRESSLSVANLSEANLTGVDLYGVDLQGANLTRAELTKANLAGTDLYWANFTEAKLIQVSLNGARLYQTNFSGADLSEADLIGSQIIETNFENANLSGSKIYGISAWNINLERAKQSDLVITRKYAGEPTITVDNLKIAQFIYLLLNNREIRDVIDTVAQKAVLILGRFTEKRLVVLNAIRDKLREHNYLPILFDFDKPASRNITETVSTVAHLARFIIADLTDPQAIPQELQKIIPALPSVPVQPILQVSTDGNIEKPKNEWGMFWDFMQYCSVLDIYDYDSLEYLITSFESDVIAPAEAKARELSEKRLRIQEKKFRTRQKRERERNDG